MADARINALTEDTALVDGDWLVAEVGDSEARKVSVANLRTSLLGTAGLFPLTKLFDETKGSSAATFDTGTFSTSLAHLLVIAHVRTTEATIISFATMTFNADAGNNYDQQSVRGRDTTASAADGQAGLHGGWAVPGASSAAGVFGAALVLVPDYSGTVAEKSGILMAGMADEAATGGDAGIRGLHWRNTAAISQVTLTAQSASNFLTGSRVTVYGIG